MPVNSAHLGSLYGFQVLLLKTLEKKASLFSDDEEMKNENGVEWCLSFLTFKEITIKNLSRQ